MPGQYDCWPLQGGLNVIAQNQEQVSVFVILGETQESRPSGFLVAFHLPGMTGLIFLELSNATRHPGNVGDFRKGNNGYHRLR